MDRHRTPGDGSGPRWRRVLASRRLPVGLAAVTFLLTLPALSIGWQLDDHFQRLVMVGKAEGDLAPMEAFSVLTGEPEVNRAFRDLGYLPWWTPDDFRLAFFRPLTLVTTRIDYLLWPDSAAMMHLHSLLWYAGLVVAATLLYRRLLEPAWVAGLAALAFALDEAHTGPVAWLANRNALLAAFFGVLCLLAHDRWRRQAWRPGAFWAPLLLAAGLLSAEIALATTSYLFAYALFLEPGARRLRSLAPYAAVVALWSAIYVAGGYGARGSGVYVDPLRDPTTYTQALIERAPFSVIGQLTPIPAELGALFPPEAARPWWLLAAALTLVLTAGLLPVVRSDPRARFWGLGMLLSVLPIAATFPSNRNLIFVGLGGMGLVALFLEHALGGPGKRGLAALSLRVLAWGLAVTHLVIAPLLLPFSPITIRQLGEPMITAAESLGSDSGLAERDLILVNSPDYLMFVTNLPTLQALEGRPLPRRLLALSTGPTPVVVQRLDERSLEISLGRGLFSGPLGRLFRDRGRPLEPGSVLSAADVQIEVLAAEGGSPRTLRYRFPRPLEDGSFRWVRWQDGRYVPFQPPAVGEKVSLAKVIGPLDAFGW